jgi:hypothetical protein
MSPGASSFRWPTNRAPGRGGVIWPSVVAILFATFAAISFAVDQSVTVSILADLPLDIDAQ